MTYHRPSKDEYYLEIAKTVSKRSTCLKRQYGAVLVNRDEIIATGYNGSCRNAVNCCDHYDICPRMDKPHNLNNYDDCQSVHAEQNCIISASRKDMIGATLYMVGFDLIHEIDNETNEHTITWQPIKDISPCPICMRMLKNAGIKTVIGHNIQIPIN